MHGCYANKLEATNQHCPFSTSADIMGEAVLVIFARSMYRKILLQKYCWLARILLQEYEVYNNVQ